MHKLMLFILFIASLSSCTNNSATQERNAKQDSIIKDDDQQAESSRIHIDTLLSPTSKKEELHLELRKLSNLDKLNGFRGLQFNMHYDSIDFRAVSIDTFDWQGNKLHTYSPEGIISITRPVAKEDVTVTILFYRKRLGRITVRYNYTVKENGYHNKLAEEWMAELIYDDLQELFGPPNSEMKKEKRKGLDLSGISIAESFYDYEHHTDKIEKAWQTSKIRLEFTSYISYSTNKDDPKRLKIRFPFSVFDKSDECVVNYAILTYHLLNSTNEIDEALKAPVDSIIKIEQYQDSERGKRQLFDKY